MNDGPEALVDAVLAALRGGLEEGADALWTALTPSARVPLGDLANLRRALTNAWLAPLVGHTEARVAAWERADGVARTRLSVIAARSGAASGAASEAASEAASGAVTGAASEAASEAAGEAGREAAIYLVSARCEADGTWRLSGLRRDDLPWS